MTRFAPLSAIAATGLVLCLTAGPLAAQSVQFNTGHLDMLDSDGTGDVSLGEFNAFSDYAYDQIDADNDGAVSPSEYGVHMPAAGFGGIDTDGDGSISHTEFTMQMTADFAAADADGNGLLD